jgi:predicted transcriptional regulator
MYKSNLNYTRFQKYFNSFLEKGLLQEVENNDGRARYYSTSKRGKTLLKALKEAKSIFSKVDLLVNR